MFEYHQLRCDYSTFYTSTTVQPEGIPLSPEGNDVIDASLVNVPVAAVFFNQLSKAPDPKSVTYIVTELSDVQFSNIDLYEY